MYTLALDLLDRFPNTLFISKATPFTINDILHIELPQKLLKNFISCSAIHTASDIITAIHVNALGQTHRHRHTCYRQQFLETRQTPAFHTW